MNRVDTALRNFDAGMNCAQAVVSAYESPDAQMPESLIAAACGFGAGMGRLQETCGAVTGAFMVISQAAYHRHAGNFERKEDAYARVKAFAEKFTARYGTLRCKELLNVDLNTEEGHLQMKEQDLRDQICKRCIADSIQIIDAMP